MSKHIHILGVCGTFMAGIAVLAKQLGYRVSGCDAGVYPPMSTQLESQGIDLIQGFEPSDQPEADVYVVGNVIKRGNPMMEHVLNQNLPYISGPQWLYEHVLKDRHVLAVAGTHGKTTTASMLAWVLDCHGAKAPRNDGVGFLIGGIPENFDVSARLGDSDYFIIEADEYDSAFFDKRSKFIHYHPRTCVLNNLEFDHADIFDDLDAIKKQFHHLIRTIPSEGLIVSNAQEKNLDDVLEKGCWTPVEKFNNEQAWHAKKIKEDGSVFEVFLASEKKGEVHWDLMGDHNVQNALAVIAAANHVSVKPADAIERLSVFKNVKRRMEIKGVVNNITVYDDFAHHPTAITSTIAGLRARIGQARMLAVIELASYTMRTGVHGEAVNKALSAADAAWVKDETNSTDSVLQAILKEAKPGDHILIMSNRGFDGIYDKLLEGLEKSDVEFTK